MVILSCLFIPFPSFLLLHRCKSIKAKLRNDNIIYYRSSLIKLIIIIKFDFCKEYGHNRYEKIYFCKDSLQILSKLHLVLQASYMKAGKINIKQRICKESLQKWHVATIWANSTLRNRGCIYHLFYMMYFKCEPLGWVLRGIRGKDKSGILYN